MTPTVEYSALLQAWSCTIVEGNTAYTDTSDFTETHSCPPLLCTSILHLYYALVFTEDELPTKILHFH